MSENNVNEVMETTEMVEKVGLLEKAKDFGKTHKKGLLIGAAVATGAVIIGGLMKMFIGKNEEFDYDSDDYVDSYSEEVEDNEPTE